MFTEKQFLQLQDIYTRIRPTIVAQLEARRPAMEEVYSALQLASDISPDTLKGEARNRRGLKDKLTNQEIPICKAMKEAGQAYLHGTFLTGSPIIGTVASRQNEDAAAMLTELTRRDQERFKWVQNIDHILSDVLDYNLGIAEVQWTYKRANSISTRVVPGSAITGEVSPITYEGNAITRIDPYNAFFSQHCLPSEVHTHGTFAGYVAITDYIGLKRKYSEWDSRYTYKANIDPIFKSSSAEGIYKKLELRKPEKKSPTNDWGAFWGTTATISKGDGHNGIFEICYLYAVLIPQEYGITELPNKGLPRIFKLTFVNCKIASAEPVLSGHDYLPIIVSQYTKGGEDARSFVEHVLPMQNLATGLTTASLDSMRRAVSGGDRLYDPLMIAPADIDSPAPAKNIQVKTNTVKSLDQALKNIPYEDRISGNFTAFMGLVQNLAQMCTGINPSAQGNFIKGNKTTFEFDSIMAASQARLQLGAIQLEGTLFSAVKEMIRLNYLLYAKSENIQDKSDSERDLVEIDPKLLREVAPDFKMSDGLMPSTKLANTEVLTMALQTMQTIPELTAEYDLPGMLVSILKQQGLSDLHLYKRTEEQRNEYLARQQQLLAAQQQAQ